MAAIKTLCLTSLFLIVSRISALQTGSDSKTACESSDVTIGFNFTIGNDSFADRSWYKNSVIPANKIARVVGAAGSLTVESQYIGRIALSGSGGIIMYNVTKTDSGSYLFIIVTGTYFEDGTATTTVNVYVNPNASCIPKIEKNSADKFNCTISDACPGKDSIQAIWDDRSVGVFTCHSTTKDTKYKCCAKGDPVTYCNSGGLCTDIECKGSGTTTTTNVTVTSSSLSSTPMSSTPMSSTSMFSTSMSSTSMFSTSMSSTPMSSTSMFSTYMSSTSMSSTFTSSTSMFSTSMSSTSMFSTSMSSTSMSSSTSSSTSATSSTFTSTSPTTNKTSTGNNGTKGNISGTDIKVIVPAVVVPCGLLIIGAIVLVIFCVRRKAGKNVRESPDGMAIQDEGNNIDGWKQSLGHGNNIDKWKQSFRHGNNIDEWKQSFRHGNNIDGWKQSFRHGKATDNLDTVYTTPDGFIIYPGPAAVSTARSYKDKKYHGVTDQYSIPNPGKHHRQADYIPSTFTSARAYTHRGKNHHVVTDQYSRPYPGNYGNQTAYFPSTYKSARTYAQKGKTYEGHQPASNTMATSRLAYDQPASNLMANSRLAYGQTAYYPQTGYYGQSSQDVYCSGGGQHSYGQRSRSHHDHNGRKQQRDYYGQYEMADYRGDITGYRHTKQDTAFYY